MCGELNTTDFESIGPKFIVKFFVSVLDAMPGNANTYKPDYHYKHRRNGSINETNASILTTF
jgi:hypothetical protein